MTKRIGILILSLGCALAVSCCVVAGVALFVGRADIAIKAFLCGAAAAGVAWNQYESVRTHWSDLDE